MLARSQVVGPPKPTQSLQGRLLSRQEQIRAVV